LAVRVVPGADGDVVRARVHHLGGVRGAHRHHAEDRLAAAKTAPGVTSPPPEQTYKDLGYG
jgi:hypothetical protein